MDEDSRTGPYFFPYYVFESREQSPSEKEIASGIHLVGQAHAEHLRPFFDVLYEKTEIGICPSDDELITGPDSLSALLEALEEAIKDVDRRPEEWPVTVGYEMAPFSEIAGPPHVQNASKSTLLAFLGRVAAMVAHARQVGGYIHFHGGQ